ncbi:MAG: preprotein translocase subunit SecE [Bryobacteraceae bacterium]|jgi:preprotein translocase subunit SecE
MEGNNLVQSITSWPTRTRDYFNELKLEMRRVSWPNRKQVEGTTAVVVLTVFAFAGFFAIVDAILNDTIVKLYHAMSR